MRNIWYAICDTLDEFKESRIIKQSFGWEVLDVISSDAPVLDIFFILLEFVLFLCCRKKRR